MKIPMDVCDFHAHILPNADHGSSSVDISLAQLRLAERCGVGRIFATPHFYPHRDSAESFLARRDAAYLRLNKAAQGICGLSDIRLGAEVLLCDNIENLPGIEGLCVYGTRTILLELPFTDFSVKCIDSFEVLAERGYKTVIAHADRYNPRNIEQLLSVGAVIQLNAESLCGFIKNRVLYKWIEDGKVVALGSDIHGADKKAYIHFSRALSKLGSLADRIKAVSDEIWEQSKPYPSHTDKKT